MWRERALKVVLVLVGFVLYQVLGANKSGHEISRRACRNGNA